MSSRGKLVNFLMKGGHPRRKQNKPQIMEAAKKTKWNILRGDQVQVISRAHPECGKQGIVLKVDRLRDRVIVENVNMGSKNVKADPDRGRPGRTIRKERSMHYSNVNLVDPVTGQPTRVFKKFLEDGTKVRVAKKSGAIIPRPETLTARKRPKPMNVTESDTSSDEDVWDITYNPDEVTADIRNVV